MCRLEMGGNEEQTVKRRELVGVRKLLFYLSLSAEGDVTYFT